MLDPGASPPARKLAAEGGGAPALLLESSPAPRNIRTSSSVLHTFLALTGFPVSASAFVGLEASSGPWAVTVSLLGWIGRKYVPPWFASLRLSLRGQFFTPISIEVSLEYYEY